MVTEIEIKEAMIAADITRVNHHECGICGQMTAYLREGENLFFDSNCRCSSYDSEPGYRSWESVAQWVNIQREGEFKEQLKASFGITVPQAE